MPIDKSIENKSLEGYRSLEETPLNDKEIHFSVLCNHSIHKKDLYFHNFVDRKDNSLIVDNIKKVLELDNKDVKSYNIPIEQVNESSGIVRLNPRMRNILNVYNYYATGDLLKCSPKTGLRHKIPKDTLRFVVDYENNRWLIVLIDPWHMFATSRYKTTYQEFKKKARYNIKDLI